jgi:hypothetical protein
MINTNNKAELTCFDRNYISLGNKLTFSDDFEKKEVKDGRQWKFALGVPYEKKAGGRVHQIVDLLSQTLSKTRLL